MTRAAFRQCDVSRAVKAAKACGLAVTGLEITPAGVIRVLTATPEAPQGGALDQWRAARARHSPEGA